MLSVVAFCELYRLEALALYLFCKTMVEGRNGGPWVATAVLGALCALADMLGRWSASYLDGNAEKDPSEW